MSFRLDRRAVLFLAVACVLAFGAFGLLSGRRARDAQPSALETAVQDTPPARADTVVVKPEQPVVAPPPLPVSLPAARPDSVITVKDSTQPKVRFRAGEDPDFAIRMGWPVSSPAALAGAILPDRRIVAYYGNPLSNRMGVLGEYEPREMLRRLDREVEAWRKADPATPVQPALHLIAVVAQGDAGPSGKYRTIMRDSLIETVYGWAKSKNAILFLDIQTGHSDIRELLPRFDHLLVRPDIHLAIDPEFMMKSAHKPGARIGTMDASDINYAASHLAELVRKNNLPTKVLVIHRFTRGMVTGASTIKLRPEVQVVMDMDGWGAPWLKRDSYKAYIVQEPVQYAGFKLFYHNDTKKGDALLTPSEVLKLRPAPLYIQYQ